MNGVLARRLLLSALGIGLLAEWLLDGPAPGLNVVVLVAVTLLAGWRLRRRDRAPDPLDAWLPVAATVLAAFVAVRADPFVAALDVAGALACTGAATAAFSGIAVTRRSASRIAAVGAWVIEGVLAGTARLLLTVRPRGAVSHAVGAWGGPVGRGLVLAIPLAVIFAVLFASADPIFQQRLDDILGLRIDLGDLPGRILFVLAAAWCAGGLLTVAATGIPAVERASLGAAARTAPISAARSLGTTEAVVILVAVDIVVGLFVGLQLAYLFGGLDTLSAGGMTYSSYARRGYFELVAAACLAGGLLVALEYAVARRSRFYVAMALALVAGTVVVLASAALRLQLYQDAYGWTELRLYVAVSIGALAATLATLAVFLAVDRTRWLGHAVAAIGLASLVGLNLLAPAAYVAERNLARILDPSLVPADGRAALDISYLEVLPDDAIPVIVQALPHLRAPDQAAVRRILDERRRTLASDSRYAGLAAWNLGREHARDALRRLP